MRKAIILIFAFLVFAKISYAINEILPADRSFAITDNNVPAGICYDRGNNTIFIADVDTVTIQHYTPDGTKLGVDWSTAGGGGTNNGRGMACLNSTHLLIPEGDVAGRLNVWTQSGTLVVSLDMSANTPVISSVALINQSYIYLKDRTNKQIDVYKKSTTTSGWVYENNFAISNITPQDAVGLCVVNTTQGYYLFTTLGNPNTANALVNISRYNISGNFGSYDNYAKTDNSHVAEKTQIAACAFNVTSNGSIQFFYSNTTTALRLYQASLDVLVLPSIPDTAPPNISTYNMTSEGGEVCINWNTSKSNPCSTSDVTPTVSITTNEPAWCAIGTQDINFTRYDELGINRSCVNQGTQSLICTLASEDELVYDNSTIYISCRDASNNTNTNSTSGALSLNVTGLEAAGRDSIEIGIQNALLSGYTTYADHRIYARNSANNQSTGRFDKIVKKLNKIWAFNRIGVSDSHVNMVNITPVLYTFEFANKTTAYIENQTALLINATK